MSTNLLFFRLFFAYQWYQGENLFPLLSGRFSSKTVFGVCVLAGCTVTPLCMVCMCVCVCTCNNKSLTVARAGSASYLVQFRLECRGRVSMNYVTLDELNVR